MIDGVDRVDNSVWAIGLKPWYFSGGKDRMHHVIKHSQGKWYLHFSVLAGIIDNIRKSIL